MKKLFKTMPVSWDRSFGVDINLEVTIRSDFWIKAKKKIFLQVKRKKKINKLILEHFSRNNEKKVQRNSINRVI